MKGKKIPIKQSFIGRHAEKARLKEIGNAKESAIIIVYGRRRIGKTELLEQSFRTRNILKFEGRENLPESHQMQQVLNELSIYTDEPLIKNIKIETWSDVFRCIHRYTEEGEWTIYFEEVQWLAQYKNNFVSELKYFWDNYFRYNSNLIIILCGSAPSFMIEEVIHSKALYNRSQHELALQPFSLQEAREFLPKHSNREVMDAYLSVGGIPLYLEYLKQSSSIFLSLCNHAFTQDGFFTREYKRIFISNLANNKNYQKIIRFLSKRRFATRQEILTHLKISSGKNISELLTELKLCGFINQYTPYSLGASSKLVRYCITDAYLQFYFKFIEPIQDEIETGKFHTAPQNAINRETYAKWLGFAFERFCRNNSHQIAKILGFNAVHYRAGVFFDRQTSTDDPNYQIDLIFDRADHVITVCEIKYSINPVSSQVINEVARKIELFPNKKKKTLHKVLIASHGVTDSVRKQIFFDQILTLDDLFKEFR